jgi:hydrogenase-4 component F
LVAGNILAVYKTKATGDVKGVMRVLPISGLLWVAGFLAITGSPPFGLFLSEFTILKAAVETGHIAAAIACVALLAVIFIGMASVVIHMAQGEAPSTFTAAPRREAILSVLPPAVLGAAVLALGLYIPPVLSEAIRHAAAALEGL